MNENAGFQLIDRIGFGRSESDFQFCCTFYEI